MRINTLVVVKRTPSHSHAASLYDKIEPIHKIKNEATHTQKKNSLPLSLFRQLAMNIDTK